LPSISVETIGEEVFLRSVVDAAKALTVKGAALLGGRREKQITMNSIKIFNVRIRGAES
jgi:hypothetical protein